MEGAPIAASFDPGTRTWHVLAWTRYATKHKATLMVSQAAYQR